MNKPAESKPPPAAGPGGLFQEPPNTGVVGLPTRNLNRDDDDMDGDLLFMIEDEDGKGYWDSLFGLDVSSMV